MTTLQSTPRTALKVQSAAGIIIAALGALIAVAVAVLAIAVTGATTSKPIAQSQHSTNLPQIQYRGTGSPAAVSSRAIPPAHCAYIRAEHRCVWVH